MHTYKLGGQIIFSGALLRARIIMYNIHGRIPPNLLLARTTRCKRIILYCRRRCTYHVRITPSFYALCLNATVLVLGSDRFRALVQVKFIRNNTHLCFKYTAFLLYVRRVRDYFMDKNIMCKRFGSICTIITAMCFQNKILNKCDVRSYHVICTGINI